MIFLAYAICFWIFLTCTFPVFVAGLQSLDFMHVSSILNLDLSIFAWTCSIWGSNFWILHGILVALLSLLSLWGICSIVCAVVLISLHVSSVLFLLLLVAAGVVVVVVVDDHDCAFVGAAVDADVGYSSSMLLLLLLWLSIMLLIGVGAVAAAVDVETVDVVPLWFLCLCLQLVWWWLFFFAISAGWFQRSGEFGGTQPARRSKGEESYGSYGQLSSCFQKPTFSSPGISGTPSGTGKPRQCRLNHWRSNSPHLSGGICTTPVVAN